LLLILIGGDLVVLVLLRLSAPDTTPEIDPRYVLVLLGPATSFSQGLWLISVFSYGDGEAAIEDAFDWRRCVG